MNYQRRKKEMTRLRHQEGWTIQKIGDRFGISRERVRQIIGNTGANHRKELTRRILDGIDLSTKTTPQVLSMGLLKSETMKRMGSIHHRISGAMPKQGEQGERIVSKKLNENGIANQLMPPHHPFDILLENGLKIDVKYCRKPCHTSPKIKSPQWHFSTKKPQNCDFYACLTKNGDVFFVPSNKAPIPLYICWPTKRPELSRWEPNNFDALKDFA